MKSMAHSTIEAALTFPETTVLVPVERRVRGFDLVRLHLLRLVLFNGLAVLDQFYLQAGLLLRQPVAVHGGRMSVVLVAEQVQVELAGAVLGVVVVVDLQVHLQGPGLGLKVLPG